MPDPGTEPCWVQSSTDSRDRIVRILVASDCHECRRLIEKLEVHTSVHRKTRKEDE